MGGFLSSIFGGSNPTLNSGISQLGNISQYGVNSGEQDLNQAGGFWSSILSGDPTKIGQVLGSQIQGIQQQGQQEKQQLGQFSNRSGGTNAKAQTIGDTTRSNVNNLIGNLTGAAASNLGSMGQNLLSQGTSALGSQLAASQEQMQNWQNSIFGSGLSMGIGGIEGFGVGKL